jgi:ABC-2 type transport system permease protein
MMFGAAVTILGKDLRLRLRDRSLLLFAVVVPLGLTVLFSFILPDEGEIELTGAVVDEDGGDVAAGFAEGVLPALEDEGLLTRVEVADASDALERTRSGELDVAWIVPDGFSDGVAAGQGAELEVLVAAGRTIEGEVARGVADAFAAQLERISLAVAVEATAAGQPPTPERIQAIASDAEGHTPVIDVQELVAAGEEQLDMVSYLAAGMASFFVFFVVSSGVVGLLEERQQGTMPRLLAAPIPPAAVQLGKALGALVVGLASMTVLTVTGALVLGASWGPPLGVAVLIVALVLAAMGVMALVGSVARTAEQANNFQSVVAVVLGLLGGVFFPLPAEGGLLRLATSASPHGWFIRGLSELSASGEWTVVFPAAGAMLAFAVVAAVPAVWLQRRMPA